MNIAGPTLTHSEIARAVCIELSKIDQAKKKWAVKEHKQDYRGGITIISDGRICLSIYKGGKNRVDSWHISEHVEWNNGKTDDRPYKTDDFTLSINCGLGKSAVQIAKDIQRRMLADVRRMATVTIENRQRREAAENVIHTSCVRLIQASGGQPQGPRYDWQTPPKQFTSVEIPYKSPCGKGKIEVHDYPNLHCKIIVDDVPMELSLQIAGLLRAWNDAHPVKAEIETDGNKAAA